MNTTMPFGAHEIMEVHELLNMKTACVAKAKLMDGVVTDRDLKQLVQQDLQQSLQALTELESLLLQVQVK